MNHERMRADYEELVRLRGSDLREIHQQLHRLTERKDFTGYTPESFQEIIDIGAEIASIQQKVNDILQHEIRNSPPGYNEWLAKRYEL